MNEDLKNAARKYAIPSYINAKENYLDEYPYDKIAESAFIAGAKWDRNQMMKGAVEGTITCHNLNRYILVSGLDESLTYGDKVRVIVLPKEDDR